MIDASSLHVAHVPTLYAALWTLLLKLERIDSGFLPQAPKKNCQRSSCARLVSLTWLMQTVTTSLDLGYLELARHGDGVEDLGDD